MTKTRHESERAAWVYAVVGLLLTISLALVWSHWKLLWVDEMLVLETDSAPTVRAVLHTQRTTPIALDPAAYHVVVHFFLKLFGNTALSLRLPSLAGFVTMQICLFLLVRRIAGARSAVLALLLPAISGTFYYATETRPYGMLLGCFGLAALSYCRAAEPPGSGRRLAWLVLLAVAIGLALNTHYFGLLLLGPLAAAELTRIVYTRRIDPPMLGAMLLGAVCYLFTRPFQAGALRYRQHYYNAGGVHAHAVIASFRLILLNLQFRPTLERVTSLVIAVFCLACFLLPILYALRRQSRAKPHELALLLALSLLPFAGVGIGVFLTHSFEVRYVLGAILGFAGLFALALAPSLRRTVAFHSVAVASVAILILLNVYRIATVHAARTATLTALTLSPEQRNLLLSGSEPVLYVQNGGWFQQLAYYEQDREVRNRLALLYSFTQEMHYGGRDTNAITAQNMRAFTGFQIVPWEQMAAKPGEHRFLIYATDWDWVPYALQDPKQHATVHDLGSVLGGELYGVTLPNGPDAAKPTELATPVH